MSKNIDKWLFKASIAFLLLITIFSYGFLVGRFKVMPYGIIIEIYSAAKSLLNYGRFVPEKQLIKSTKSRLMDSPVDSSGELFAIHNPKLMMKGYYIFQGWDDHNKCNSAWLYNHLGELLHAWEIDYDALDQDGPLNKSDSPHGFAILEDGSIIVNFDRGDVMARINSCGTPVWTKQGVFHHSLQQAEDGSFWTWQGEGSAYSQYQYLVNFDPVTGNTIRKIGLVEDIIQQSDITATIFSLRSNHNFKHFERAPDSSYDLFHPNDIDVLNSDIAPMFPDFEAGDLLISIKRLNLISILDPDSLSFKWHSYGPWLKQHDPDFTPVSVVTRTRPSSGTTINTLPFGKY